MPLSAATLAQIDASPGWRRNRVEVLDTPDGRLLVKGQRPLRSGWGYRLLNGMAWLTGVPLLKAAPAYGGSQAQTVEATRLRALRAAGVPVPEVLHEAPDYLAMQYLGKRTLLDEIKLDEYKLSPEHCLRMWKMGLDAVADLHRRGQYLSQGFARNLIWHEGQVWFIDFEDDPLEVMDLTSAQMRDWFAYLYSCILFLHALAPQMLPIWNQIVDAQTAAVSQLMHRNARHLTWLRLFPNRRNWGRDVVNLHHMGSFLATWLQTF